MLNARTHRERFIALVLSFALLASLIVVPAWSSGAAIASAAYRAMERMAAASAQVLYRTDSGEIQASLTDGALEIYYKSATTAKLKLRVAVEGSSSFTNYDLKANKKIRITPKSQAPAYTIQICENIKGTQYRIAYEGVVRAQASILPGSSAATAAPSAQNGFAGGQQAGSAPTNSANYGYLASVDQVNWSQGMACIQKAQELASGKGSNREKAEAIYDFLVSRMSYDFSKVGKLPSSYKPDLDSTYSVRTGICYDIAALYAGMLRSVGVPTKLVMGYTSMVGGYHAWNQVDLGDGSWYNVDVTTDCQLRGYGEPVSFSAPKGTFSAVKEY